MFQRAQKTETMLDLFRETNGAISYERIEQHMGETIAELRSTIQNVRKYLERDEGIVFECVPRVGYRRLNDSEKVASSDTFAFRIRRSAINGVTRVNTVSNFAALSNADQMKATLRKTVFEAVQREVGEKGK